MGICRREFGACMLGGLAARWLPAASPRTRLIVLVLAENMRADSLDPGNPQFAPGGFRRLLEKGAWFPDCRHLSSTFSACGIANLATGAWPSQHGIVADSWYDRAAGRAVAASDEDLLATTLGAQAVAAGARVSVVALTRAHAALFGGTRGARLFFLDERGRFTASGVAPDWLDSYNRSKPPEAARGAAWMAVNAAPDAPPLRTLTFDGERPQEFLWLYKASPFGQAALFDFAGELAGRDKLGQGDDPDLLCILDGSAALLGYETGGGSPLMSQMVLQLDRRVETLLNQLSHAVGENGFNLVLSAAHGAPPEPPPAARPRMAVAGEAIAQAVESGIKAAGSHVEKYVYPFLYLKGGEGDPENFRLLAARAAMEQPAVAGFYTARGACSTHDEWERRFRNSFHMKRSGDVMLSYRPEYVEDFGAGRGVSYGSLYNYDARVPLCFYGPQFRAGVFESPVEAVDVAPTLARVMGIAEPSTAAGRVLGEALAL
ncbi:MAG: alkaline phosphatase family protein [Bryobacteraceae bacterium]